MTDKKPVPPSLAQFALEQLAETSEQAAIDLTVQNVEILRAEIERRDARIVELERFEAAYNEWHDKTEWVQAEVSAGVIGFRALGRHRADVMTGLVDELRLELAALKAQQPSASVVDEREEFEAWRVDNFCGGIERLKKCNNAPDVYYYTAEQEAWRAWQARARLNPCRAQSVPDVLFDGFAVYSALDAKARGRTSPENVSDTLDAAVRLIRAAAPSAKKGS